MSIFAKSKSRTYQGHVDVAGVQLHVDLLVDQGLAVLLVVLSDAGSHDDVVVAVLMSPPSVLFCRTVLWSRCVCVCVG